MNTLDPTLLGFNGPAKATCYGFAESQGLIALTDHPIAVKKVIPLRVHGEVETPYLPAILALPLITGPMRQKNARMEFASFFAIACANDFLADYNAYEPNALLFAGQKTLEMVEAEFAGSRSADRPADV